jgi:hypothetical protein
VVSEAVVIDVDAVAALAARLRLVGEALLMDAGGLDRSVPVVPEDEHGLARAVVAFDEARAAFERRLALVVESTAAATTSSVDGVQQADAAGAAAMSGAGAGVIGRALGGLVAGS